MDTVERGRLIAAHPLNGSVLVDRTLESVLINVYDLHDDLRLDEQGVLQWIPALHRILPDVGTRIVFQRLPLSSRASRWMPESRFEELRAQNSEEGKSWIRLCGPR